MICPVRLEATAEDGVIRNTILYCIMSLSTTTERTPKREQTYSGPQLQ